jgi:acetoin utilization protein AcuB
MRQPVTTIGDAATARDAAALMREQGIRHLPVVDSAGRLVGIVTDRDLRQIVLDIAMRGRVGRNLEHLGALPVREVMTWGAVTVTPGTELRAAAALMRERRLGALPVVDRGRVVGILTERDLVGALVAVLNKQVAHPVAGTEAGSGEWEFGFPVADTPPRPDIGGDG